MKKEVSVEEKKQFFSFWLTQRNAIQNRMSEKTLRWFNIYTAKDNVGYEFGQLRPGKFGQWDLYWSLTDPQISCDENEAIIASGLTAAEMAEEKRREYYRQNYVNPDDALEVMMFERMKNMTPEDLDQEIERLEKRLAGGEKVTT